MKRWYLFLCGFLLMGSMGCSSDSDEPEEFPVPVISGLSDSYSLQAGEELCLSPEVEHAESAVYHWSLDGEVVSTEPAYCFRSVEAGDFRLCLSVKAKGGIAEKEMRVIVVREPVKLEVEAYMLLPLGIPDVSAKEVTWSVVATASDLYRLSLGGVANGVGSASFIAAREGLYHLQAEYGGIVKDVMITVKEQAHKLSPYTATVFDYMPAPGQFVNELPEYKEGDTHEDMVRKAGEWLIGEDAYMVTLGGWGGYVTIGFDHTIINVAGQRDFRINGNAFGAAENGRPDAPAGGSCEPGIVMVAYDKNGNGRPDDDEWYEIKGSSNFSAESELWYPIAVENRNDTRVFRDYQMTYYRPEKEASEVQAEPDNPLAFETIKDYIRWEDNQGNSGYKAKNVYHTQTYYPAWLTQDKLTFRGIRLPENGINEGQFNPGINAGGVYYVLYAFRYGYVDNSANVDDNSAIDIDWAIDKDGNKVDLPGIDFVKIYNGVNQENGWLGECSTEVERGEDLHMLGKRIATVAE